MIDRTPPAVTFTYNSDTLRYSGSISDAHLSGYRLSTSNSGGYSTASSSSATTSFISYAKKNESQTTYYYSAVDEAGNVTTKSAKNYKMCTSKVSINNTTEAMAYNWRSINTSKSDCSINAYAPNGKYPYGPYIQINMDIYKCNCTMDYHYSALFSSTDRNEDTYCSSSLGDDYSSFHGDGMAIVVYANNNNGVAACNAHANKYVQSACEDTSIPSGGLNKHGWAFYSDSSGSNPIPLGTWVHSGARKFTTYGGTAADNCAYACRFSKLS